MSKIILVVIVIVALVVIILGLYIIFSEFILKTSSLANPVTPIQNTNSNIFEIQGMKIEIIKEGSGEGAKLGDLITVHYVGTLADGTKFDSSIDRNAPFSFALGQGRVIQGWDLGVAGMKVGEKRTLIIPPELAYGASGFPPIIPKNSTLTFEIEMLKIN